jgi:predicted permease
MNALIHDFCYAMRQLRKAPGFAATAVFTLALGLGASSAIFCLIDTLWLHPLRLPHPGELVRVFSTTPENPEARFNYSEFQAFAARATALKSVFAIGGRGSLIARADGTTSLLLTNVVSDNFFDSLGVQPLLGHLFSSADAVTLRAHPGVVLGYNFWQREYAGDPAIVGRQITLLRGGHNRNTVDIWGVLPPSFHEIDNGEDRDLWMSTGTWAAIARPEDLTSHDFRWFRLLGRLAPGSTAAQASQQAAAIAKALETADPKDNHGRGARVLSDFSYRMNRAGTAGLVLFAIVGCVVLLATMNLAQLLLARALARAPEVALRLSLGARRWTVARQLLVENLTLGAFGLVAGLAFAAVIAALLPRLLVSEPAMLVVLGAGEPSFHLDWRVFFFASVLALVTMLLLAVVPVSQAARAELLLVLQAGSVTRTAAKTPILRRATIWLQIAISFAVLVSTGVLVRSFLNTRTQAIGLTRSQVLLAWTQEPDAPMRDAVVERMKTLPGVSRVAYAVRAPLSLSEGGMAVKILLPSHPEIHDPVDILYNAVSPGFLDLIGTRVVRGRGFVPADDRSGPPAVVINQAMAGKYWPTQDPVGQLIRLVGLNTVGDGAPTDLEARVVGVAENSPVNQMGEIPAPYLYLPFHFSQMGEITFALETGRNAMTMAQPVRQVLIHQNPMLDPMMVTSLPELIRYSSGSYQMIAELVTALGLIGLALTVVGLYGFLAFGVARRRREIGIRMALGATREATAWLVMRETGRLAVIGLLLGVVLSLGAARLEQSMLFGVRPLDAFSIAVSFTVLLAAVLAAAWLPARRAASVEPMQALRTE